MRSPSPRRLAALAPLVLAFAWASAAAACGPDGYTYAGFFSPLAASGIRATITPLAAGDVQTGHIGAWVGVGGPGKGPGGTDEWLQIGFSALPDTGGTQLYYELTQPGSSPSYHQIATRSAGSSARVAVLELPSRRNYWQVLVNGVVASPPIHLPGSHNRLQPTATAESWDGGTGGTCNAFLYRFAGIDVVRAPGSTWQPLGLSYPLDGYATSIRRSRDGGFVAAQN
jgi:hypothetical protein